MMNCFFYIKIFNFFSFIMKVFFNIDYKIIIKIRIINQEKRIIIWIKRNDCSARLFEFIIFNGFWENSAVGWSMVDAFTYNILNQNDSKSVDVVKQNINIYVYPQSSWYY